MEQLFLNSQNGDLGSAILACFLLGLGFCVFALIVNFGHNTKSAFNAGGIKGYYPNLIKNIMRNFPNARVVVDTPIYMCIESTDILKHVTMKISLLLNPDNRNLKAKGKIIPDNTKWAWIPSKEYNWQLKTKYGPGYAEDMLIKEINKDMVFNPKD